MAPSKAGTGAADARKFYAMRTRPACQAAERPRVYAAFAQYLKDQSEGTVKPKSEVDHDELSQLVNEIIDAEDDYDDEYEVHLRNKLKRDPDGKISMSRSDSWDSSSRTKDYNSMLYNDAINFNGWCGNAPKVDGSPHGSDTMSDLNFCGNPSGMMMPQWQYNMNPMFSYGSMRGGLQTSNFWDLARDPYGCYVVQEAFDNALATGDDEELSRLSQLLVGHVWDAIKCRNANFVLQKCIVTASVDDIEFVVDALQSEDAGVVKAAKHRYGCRVVHRLLERLKGEELEPLMEEITASCIELSNHQFGHFVIEHVLEFGAHEAALRLIAILQEETLTCSAEGYIGAVLGHAITHHDGPEATALVDSLAAEPRFLCSMARSRWGHKTVQMILQRTSNAQAQEEAMAYLASQSSVLRPYRYGRILDNWMKSKGETQ